MNEASHNLPPPHSHPHPHHTPAHRAEAKMPVILFWRRSSVKQVDKFGSSNEWS